mgnify:CR=1 FL=1
MTDLEGASVQKGVFVPCDVLRALQGRDLRLRALEVAILHLDRELRDVIERDVRMWIASERAKEREGRPAHYFIVDNRAVSRAERLMQVQFPYDSPSDEDARASKQPSKLDEAMEAATINAENPAIISIRRDHQALLDRLRDQNKHLEASDRHRNQLERRVVKLENSALTRAVKEWLVEHPDQMPIIPIHGDMTPWNIYVDGNERLVLSSFERAGWHVPFYDVFHFHLQPQALLGRPTQSVHKLLAGMPWESYPWLEQALVLYLIDQLCCDLGDLYDKQYNDPWLLPMIRKKEKWLAEVL